MPRLVLFLSLLTLPSLSAQELPGVSLDGYEPAWLKLLHYRKNTWGVWTSDAATENFFLTSNGKKDPQAEIEALSLALGQKPVGVIEADLHPACRFPARARYLAQKTGQLLPFCPRLEIYRSTATAISVGLVFSSYYLNHPSSAFGHTFLRLNRTNRSELLDDGVSFAAATGETNPVLYALGGLLGWFPGTFSRLPYFYKVREYSDIESRDLWTYDLTLSQEEVNRLIDHLWELGQTHFDYYFLSENCSFHVLTTLEAAAPRLNLSEALSPIVIPVDTLKAVTSVPGLVAKVSFRPSLHRTWETRWKSLNDPQKNFVLELLKTQELAPLQSRPQAEQRAMLDTAIDAVDTVHYRDLVNDPAGPSAQWKHQLLLARAGLARSAPLPIQDPPEAPEQGHGTQRWGMVGGAGSEGVFSGLNFRLALHDFLDLPAGYPSTTTLSFLDTELRLGISKAQPYLEKASLLRVVQLNPWNALQNHLSWSLDLGAERVRENSADGHTVGALRFGVGATANLTEKVAIYGFLETGFQAGAFNGHWSNLLLGPRFGVRWDLPYQVRAHLSLFPNWNTHRKLSYYTSFSAELAFPLATQLALRTRFASEAAWSEIGASAYLYF